MGSASDSDTKFISTINAAAAIVITLSEETASATKYREVSRHGKA